jgi:hypothetical protein
MKIYWEMELSNDQSIEPVEIMVRPFEENGMAKNLYIIFCVTLEGSVKIAPLFSYTFCTWLHS